MRIARIDPATSVVTNIEVADQEWLDAQPTDGDLLVPYDDGNAATIGLAYDPQTGVFEQPPGGA